MPLLTFTSATGLPATSNTVVSSPYKLSINISKRSETPMRLSTMNIQIRTRLGKACAKSTTMPTASFPLLKLAVGPIESNNALFDAPPAYEAPLRRGHHVRRDDAQVLVLPERCGLATGLHVSVIGLIVAALHGTATSSSRISGS